MCISDLTPKRPDEKYFEEQPDAISGIEKQLIEDRKREAKKRPAL